MLRTIRGPRISVFKDFGTSWLECDRQRGYPSGDFMGLRRNVANSCLSWTNLQISDMESPGREDFVVIMPVTSMCTLLSCERLGAAEEELCLTVLLR
jgi:hypothetical protein